MIKYRLQTENRNDRKPINIEINHPRNPEPADAVFFGPPMWASQNCRHIVMIGISYQPAS